MREEQSANVAIGLRNGDVGCFDMLVERYGERLYWHIRRIVVQHEEAEDLLQETFVMAFTLREKFRGDTESSLKAWLYKIATTLSIKALRRRRRGLFSSIDSIRGDLIATFEQERDHSADELLAELQRAILALPTKQRLVFNMRYYDELPFEQISEITGDSIATLKTNYHYAAKKIKESITTIEL